MKTTNAMQLKAIIKNRARRSDISPQLLMQDYLLERLLERISKSQWRDYVVVKGGMLIALFVGIDNRVTRDLDTTFRGFDLTHESAERAFREIVSVEVDDDIVFEFVRTEDIREAAEYPGIRVFLKALYPPMSVPITVDVTTGDAITPGAVSYSFPLTFGDYSIPLMTYPLETVLAEKIETVVSRGRANTRPRDYCDIHTPWNISRESIRIGVLRDALAATCGKRGSASTIARYDEEMNSVKGDTNMLRMWERYRREYSYARSLELAEACETVCSILKQIGF